MKIQRGYLTKKSGAWLGHFSRWSVDPATGQKRRKQCAERLGDIAAMSKTQARQELQRVIVRELGKVGDGRMTVSGFVSQRWKPLREGTWRESTAATNGELLKVITDRFGDDAIESLDSVALQTWVNELAKKRSSSAVKHLRIFLRSIFHEAYEQKYIGSNPARLLRLPKMRSVKRDFLEMAEVKALLKASMPFGMQTRDACLLRLVLTTGLRPSELFALRWRNVNLREGTITIEETVYRGKLRDFAKTEGSEAQLAIPKEAVEALTRQLALAQEAEKFGGKDDFVFPTSTGTFWLKENYQRRVLTPLAKQAKIKDKPVNFQTIRRTTATHALAYANLKTVQEVMRHKSSETTMRSYIQVVSGAAREAVNGMSAAMTPAKKRQRR